MAGGRGERDATSELFNWDPFSYRVNRRSALKMDLRRALAEKFLEFLGDYADETLIEYVIVLLCNGKDQYQAREGLKDFLGDDTESFVAWLWNYLRKRDVMVRPGRTASKCKKKEVQGPSSEVQQAHAGNASLAKEEPAKQLKYHVGPQLPSDNLALSSRSLGKEIHGSVIHDRSLRLKEDLHGGVSSRRPSQKKLCASAIKERIEGKSPTSIPRGTSSLAAEVAPYSPCLGENRHYKTEENIHSSTRSSRSYHRPRSDVLAIEKNIKSSNRVDKELKPARRNVWDRLGKPQNETSHSYIKETNSSFLMLPAATLQPMHPLVTQHLPSTITLDPHPQAHFVSTSLHPEGVVRTPSICTPMHVNGEIVNKLKRQFDQIENHLQANVVSPKSAQRIPAKQRLGISVGSPQPLPVGNGFSGNIVNGPAVVHKGLKPEMLSNVEPVNSYQTPQIAPKKEKKTLDGSESGNSSQEPPCVRENHLQAKVVSPTSAQRIPAKQRLGISVGSPQPLPAGNGFSGNIVNGPAVVHKGLKPEMLSNVEPINSYQTPQIALIKEKKTLDSSESGNSSQEPPFVRENHLQANVVSPTSAQRIPAKKRLGISWGSPQPLPVGNVLSSNIVNGPVVVHKGLKPEMLSNVDPVNRDQRPQIAPAEEEKTLKNSESGNSSQEPPCKMSDMKVKLDEMEIDMQDLPSLQSQLENPKPDTETSPSSGAQPSQMEDMDLRTVIVTNVHFGATKEAVVSYFAKCGPVTKVIMLRDIITGKPKGVACVTFAQQDSVEKAISLSGTSLFSRTLKVIRKADAPAGLIDQPYQVWIRAHQLPTPSRNSLHCYPNAHHQWRRETNASVSK